MRHAEIENDDVGPNTIERGQGIEPIHRLEDLEVTLETHPVQRAPCRIVVNEEHLRHDLHLLRGCRCNRAAGSGGAMWRGLTRRASKMRVRTDTKALTLPKMERHGLSPTLGNPVATHLGVESRTAQAEERRSGLLVPARGFQRPHDREPLD